VADVGKRLGLTTVLAVLQILEQTLSRLRYSTQGRILAELALVRICSLEDLDELSAVIARLQSSPPPGAATTGRSVAAGGSPAPPRRGRKDTGPSRPTPSEPQDSPSPEQSTLELTPENAAEVWTRALATMSGMVVEHARQFGRVAISGPSRLVISFKPEYALAKSFCERPDQLAGLEKALGGLTGQPVRVSFTVDEEEVDEEEVSVGEAGGAARQNSPHRRLLEVTKHPMIRRAEELFGAQPVRVDEPPEQE
jgi:DNA polymerase-3 subunit gamma/tau